MHPSEIKSLFEKANKSLSKDAFIKEKSEIKREIKENVIVNGVQKD
jgi:hypothetical protein